MAPQELVGRYREYKVNTKRLLYRITKTAKNCYDLRKIVKSLARIKKTHQVTTKTAHDHSADIEISTQERLDLAKQICSADPPVEVRKASFSSFATPSPTLKGMLEILEIARAKHANTTASTSKAKASKADVKDKKKSTDPKAALSSLFESLQLEEPVANPLGSAPLPASTMPQSATQPEFTLRHDTDNAFKTWCFLQDSADLRASVMETWKDYTNGEVSLFAAGVITDTAFGLLRRADEEFAKTSPFGSTDWSQLLEYLGITYFTRNNAIWMHPRDDKGNGLRMPESDVNVVELLCPVAFGCLESWKMDVAACCVAEKRLKKDGGLQTFEPSVQDYLHYICRLMFMNVQMIHALVHQRSAVEGARDEFLRALVEVHMASSVRVWAVVACQVYMDVFHLFGDHAWYGVTMIRQETALVKQLHANIQAYNPTQRWESQDAGEATKKLEELRTHALSKEKSMKTQSELLPKPQSVEELQH